MSFVESAQSGEPPAPEEGPPSKCTPVLELWADELALAAPPPPPVPLAALDDATSLLVVKVSGAREAEQA